MVASSTLWSAVLLASASLVAGHGAIVRAQGDAGGQGSALGIDPATPRDGTRRTPFQQDATRFQGEAADACGETLGGGANDVETGVSAVMAQNGNTLPQVSDGGQLMMTLHQINGDGAGPYTCMMDATGTGASWTTVQVTQNVPGENGRERDGATTDFPLNVQIPAGTTCSGSAAGADAMCLVRCENPANAGPFGGCVPFQMANAAGAAAGNTTASTASTASTSTTTTTSAAAAAAEEEEEEEDEEEAEERKLKFRSAKLARGLAIKKRAAADDYQFWSKKH